MLQVDSDLLHKLAPPQSGRRLNRQEEIIVGMSSSITTVLDSYSINTPLRIAHFLAQVAHESDGFCTTEEYASGLDYEHRADLGNVNDGDGPLFKGRGLIQLTGRSNYKLVGDELKLDLVNKPLSVNDPHVYLLVSCVFWRQRNINLHCDADDVISVTHLVNGGLNGLTERKLYLTKAKVLLAAVSAGFVQPPGGGQTVLHLGVSGDAVSNLQKQLSQLGYPVSIDGDFGPATQLAVQHFQAASGISADGISGADTYKALEAAITKLLSS